MSSAANKGYSFFPPVTKVLIRDIFSSMCMERTQVWTKTKKTPFTIMFIKAQIFL